MNHMSHKNLFGTDGIRASVGDSPFTQDDLIRLGKALALWSQTKYNKPQPHVLIAHDTRISCGWAKSCLKAGLLSGNIKVYDAHILPTPGASILMHDYSLLASLDYACIISASHNPYHDNGIKIIDIQGKLTHKDELLITELFYNVPTTSLLDYRALGQEIMFDNAESLYCAKIASYFEPHFLRGLKIVIDAAHGATYRTAPRIFKKLGAEVIMIHNKPNGYNINEACGAVHPESLQNAVLTHSADIGFAFDGDGDRIVAVNSLGDLKDGDDILAILAEHPLYKKCTTIVGTLMTNCGLEHHLKNQNKNLIRTPVGDKHVAQRLKEEQCMLGGEPSGHIICGDILTIGDGVVASLRVVESMLFNKNRNLKSFIKYPSSLISLPTEHKPDLTQEAYAEIILNAQKALPHGRIIVRYSGTEPVLRIMVEASTHELVQQHINNLTLQLKALLNYSNTPHHKEYYEPQESV